MSAIRIRAFPSALAGLVMAVAAAFGGGPAARAREPLPVPGKTSLYQRVLTRPDTPLTTAPGAGRPSELLPAFSILYVYGRSNETGAGYLEVGRTLQGGSEGWIPADKAIEWRQSIVLGFNNPADGARSLIFNTSDALEQTYATPDIAARLTELRQQADQRTLPPGSPVISIAPSRFVDITREFYILPILEARRIRLPGNPAAKLLRIASVSERAQASRADMGAEDALRDFKIGITFVIDTTQSMQPYIDEVQAAIRRLRDRIAGGPQADRFRFGLVAFRDSTRIVPQLDYVTRVFLPLSEASTADRFLDAIRQVQAAHVSSDGFTEDSIGGVATAMEQMNWAPFGGRYIILITDAGPRPADADALKGALAPRELQTMLERQHQLALFTLHLKTPPGRADHASAENAYRQLSFYAETPLYFPIEGGEQQAFARQIDALANELELMVKGAMDGRLQQARAGRGADISGTAGRVGLAMQLAYLGSRTSTAAPPVFEGWLTDRDPADRMALPVTPYLLMSKNELAALRDVIKRAVDIATDPMRSSRGDFFRQLRESVALAARRPEAVQSAGTLGALLGEYLQDLPYNSQVINLTMEDFRNMSPERERQLTDALKSKLRALDGLHQDSTRWHALAPGAPPGESVTIVPMTLLP